MSTEQCSLTPLFCIIDACLREALADAPQGDSWPELYEDDPDRAVRRQSRRQRFEEAERGIIASISRARGDVVRFSENITNLKRLWVVYDFWPMTPIGLAPGTIEDHRGKMGRAQQAIRHMIAEAEGLMTPIAAPGNDVANEPINVKTPVPNPENALPGQFYKLFRSKQLALLIALWGKESVPDIELIKTLGYSDAPDPSGNLHRRITETNKNLLERSAEIGQSYSIRQRKSPGGTISRSLDQQ